MNWFILSHQGRDLNFYNQFKLIWEKGSYQPINIMFDGEQSNVPDCFGLNINTTPKFSDIPIRWNWVLAYYIKRFGPATTYQYILPRAMYLIDVLLQMKANESLKKIVCSNSGEWLSRTMYEFCRHFNIEFWFWETFFLSRSYQFSKSDFICESEFFNKFLATTINSDEVKVFTDIKNDYISTRLTKWEQPTTDFRIDRPYTFIVGQVPCDTNYILNNTPFKSMEEYCYHYAITNPNEIIVFKRHPKFIKEDIDPMTLLLGLPNVKISNDNIVSLIDGANKVIVATSGVGLEAELRNKEVVWVSDTWQNKLQLSDQNRAACFFKCVKQNIVFEHNIESQLKAKGII